MYSLKRFWLRAIRISAFCVFVVFFIFIVWSTVHYLISSPFVCLIWFPYFWVFWQLRDVAEAQRVKKALANAVAWGSFGAGMSVVVVIGGVG